MALSKIKIRSVSGNFVLRYFVELCYIPGTSIFLFVLIKNVHIIINYRKRSLCTNIFEYDQIMFDY